VLDDRPPPMLTSAMGDESMERAEKVVAEVCDILGNTDLKASGPDQLSKLPSKQQILQAVAKMDLKVKAVQKDLDEQKKKLEDALVDEEEQRQTAKDHAIAQARRDAAQKLEMEEKKRVAEEKEFEDGIQGYIDDQKSIFEAEQAKFFLELEAKLKAARDDEDKRMREALNEQMITTADNFDKDIVKVRKDHERATHISKKLEAKLELVEKDCQEKMKEVGKDKPMSAAPDTSDVVARIIAENRKRAAEAHMNQLTFVSPDDDMADVPHSELEDVKDPISGRTTAEWAQMAKQVTGLADALYSEPSEAPYYAHNEKIHEAIAPLVAEFVRHKKNKLKKHWTQLAEEYEYRRTVYDKKLQSGSHAKEKPKKSVSIPVRQSIFQTGKPSQPILEPEGSRASTNPYRRARRGNEVRSEYEQEQIIAEIAAKEALEKRILFGGSDLPRQIGPLERSLNGQFINTFRAQRVDVIQQERDVSLTNVWSDMEKAIFLDRYAESSRDCSLDATLTLIFVY
jgi:hypothetical protein